MSAGIELFLHSYMITDLLTMEYNQCNSHSKRRRGDTWDHHQETDHEDAGVKAKGRVEKAAVAAVA